MRFILQDPDLAYELLLSAIETLSNYVLRDHRLSTEKFAETRPDLLAYLKSLALDERQVDSILTLVMKPLAWSRERFVRFVETYLPDNVWTEEDALYPGLGLPDLIPKRENLKDALNIIYRQRSAGSHEGRPYPAYIRIGTSPMIPVEAFRALQAAGESDRLPPITWFERVVQASIHRFVSTL